MEVFLLISVFLFSWLHTFTSISWTDIKSSVCSAQQYDDTCNGGSPRGLVSVHPRTGCSLCSELLLASDVDLQLWFTAICATIPRSPELRISVHVFSTTLFRLAVFFSGIIPSATTTAGAGFGFLSKRQRQHQSNHECECSAHKHSQQWCAAPYHHHTSQWHVS